MSALVRYEDWWRWRWPVARHLLPVAFAYATIETAQLGQAIRALAEQNYYGDKIIMGIKGRKSKRRLARRIKSYEEMIAKMPLGKQKGYTKPGSNKK